MQAIVVHALGDPDVLTLRSIPPLTPGPARCSSASRRSGSTSPIPNGAAGVYDPPEPALDVPGDEAAGRRRGARRGRRGRLARRRVAFWAPRTSGAYAEYAVAPPAALFSLRDDLDFAMAAALPAQGLTAYGLAHFATALTPGRPPWSTRPPAASARCWCSCWCGAGSGCSAPRRPQAGAG